jgi:hypothetical protein
MPSDTKPCIACFEPIHQKARKCPHCHQIQSKVAALPNHPATAWAVVSFLAMVLFGGFYLIYNATTKESRVPLVTIGSPIVRTAAHGTLLRASCFAPITNTDALTWSNPTLQAQFFNSTGSQVDVHYEVHKLTLLPTFVAEGRVSGLANASSEEYATCKLSVLHAR